MDRLSRSLPEGYDRHKGTATNRSKRPADRHQPDRPSLRDLFSRRPRSWTAKPGLVMLKIDGLPFNEARRALSNRRLPHLSRLIGSRSHRLQPFYSGMPSTTPAVQGELFYGIKSSVPAIAYFDRDTKMTVNALFPVFAGQLARRMRYVGRPLLEGGTSYSNIYSGGADEARYCIETMKFGPIRQIVSFVKLLGRLAVRPLGILRMGGYAMIEAGVSFYDFARGIAGGRNLFNELKFVPTRVVICAIIRELIRTRVKMDLAAGVPIVHASFLGYDEQAHRRGPDSAFAHWSLKGIDDVIADIHRAARHSAHREYRLVVYSDHGQEKATPFQKRFGKPLEEVVIDAVNGDPSEDEVPRAGRPQRMNRRSGYAAQYSEGRWAPSSLTGNDSGRKIRVIALGPIGHVYFAQPPTDSEKSRLAQALIDDGRVPLILYVSGETVVAVNRNGRFDPEKDTEAILGRGHAFGDLAGRDLAHTCRHADAGDLVLSGWSPDAPPLTFADENGAHGGPGKEETRGFTLMPDAQSKTDIVQRPLDLRNWVFDFFDREKIRALPRGR